MIRSNMFVLAVRNLVDSANYYESVLGFTIREVGDGGWRMFERDGCRMMVGHCPDSMPVRDLGDHSYFAYLIVDSADRYYAEIVERGAEVTKPVRSEPWGMREFGIRTIDGHRIMFGENLDG
ncbi:bleomycin resistance protein [Hydrogenophaga crassostreae]|uniref:Bleomycin resistance protein n=1 Tax=Hydrogenophaga crassostreae TaxID=1763535 RepID=A0A163CBK6_9BURK|nr:glyoxalase/bleomycin resistance/extradiol dioxygenase family protein [Hydrogenophaga crassostreae]AOW12082.1 bleomycin resistance protein [Hydrogenophaga crassostreae]OAD41026.1 bleomycin resistance protein [Hydrogenophaga crassostreae]